MIYEVTVGERTLQVDVTRAPGGYDVAIDGGPVRRVDVTHPLPDVLSMILDDRSIDAGLAARPDGYTVDVLGVGYDCRVVDPRRAALKLGGGGGEGLITTSMPGRVVRVLVSVGEAVTKGQPVLVIEAMKMENEIKAPHDGAVQEIFVEAGQALDAGASLLQVGESE